MKIGFKLLYYQWSWEVRVIYNNNNNNNNIAFFPKQVGVG